MFNKSLSHCPPLTTYFDHIPRNSNYDIFLLAIFTINIVIAIFATCSNLVIIGTILRTKSLQTASNILLLGLAISDFFVGVLTVPSFCLYKFSAYLRNLKAYCIGGIGYFIFGTTLAMVSFATLTVITADRFLAVHLHLRYKEFVTVKLYIVILVSIWILSSIGTLLRMLLFDFYFLVFTVTLYLILLILNAFFLYQIAKVIRRHTHQINAQSNASSNSTMEMPTFKKSVNTMYFIVIAFILCYAPLAFFLVFISIMTSDIVLTNRCLFSIGETFLFLNSALNPVIYCWRIEDIRNTSLSLLKSLLHKGSIEQEQEPSHPI